MIVDRETTEFVNKLLDLPASGNEQDWALELSDKTRLDEFIDLAEYSSDLSLPAQYAIMELILSSYDDYLGAGNEDSERIEDRIEDILDRNKPLYYDALNYWDMPKEIPEDDMFNITPFVRRMLHHG